MVHGIYYFYVVALIIPVEYIKEYAIPPEKEDYELPLENEQLETNDTRTPRSNLRLPPPPLFSPQGISQIYKYVPYLRIEMMYSHLSVATRRIAIPFWQHMSTTRREKRRKGSSTEPDGKVLTPYQQISLRKTQVSRYFITTSFRNYSTMYHRCQLSPHLLWKPWPGRLTGAFLLACEKYFSLETINTHHWLSFLAFWGKANLDTRSSQ